MKNIFETIKRMFMYAGLDRSEYSMIKDGYISQNRNILTVFASVMAVGTAIFTRLAFIDENPGARSVYLSACIITSVITVLNIWPGRKSTKTLAVLTGVFVFVTYLMGILNGTLNDPDNVAMTFIVLIVALPMIFNGRPVVTISEMLCADVLFIIIAVHVKSPEVLTADIADVLVFSVVSVVLNLYMARSKARGYFLQLKAEEANKAMVKALQEAESANRAKTDFLFNMSHDIRTPMNAIIGFMNMAQKHIDDKEKVLDCIEKAQSSGGMLLSLINNVLEVSRIESGNAAIEEQACDIYCSFSNIDHTMQEAAAAKDIHLSFEFGNVKDRYIWADSGRCMRIFVNIISNAIKYTPAGGTVTVRCEQLGDARDGCGTYEYTFTDNGIGMSEEFRKHIFDRFSREENSTVSKVQGSGLGMSVVKSFTELMGGKISVQSEQGKGTEVRLVLPFRIQEGREYTDPATGEVVSSVMITNPVRKVNFAGKKVLLVEDNELNREIAVDILEEEGLMVEDADDGTTAVEKLREKGPYYYDFILMDIQMPKMNGYEAAKAIREMYPEARLPIIALSANAFAEDKKRSLEAGMDDHVAKPINIKELFGALAEFL